MKIGENVSFTYLKDVELGYGNGGRTADYAKNAESYQGEVVEIRNIQKSPLSWETIQYGKPKGYRSENLVTVELKDGDTKAFYDGRMVGRRVISPTTKAVVPSSDLPPSPVAW
jgi:hypothetical protein|tara:strand:- start:185 stop:523 length:339 start_codon:yes stop_codon:yes gene_type:complete